MQENSLGIELRNIKGQTLKSGNGSRQQPSRKQLLDSTSLSDSRSTEASTSLSMDDFGAVDSACIPSSSRPAEVIFISLFCSITYPQLLNKTKQLIGTQALFFHLTFEAGNKSVWQMLTLPENQNQLKKSTSFHALYLV